MEKCEEKEKELKGRTKIGLNRSGFLIFLDKSIGEEKTLSLRYFQIISFCRKQIVSSWIAVEEAIW